MRKICVEEQICVACTFGVCKIYRSSENVLGKFWKTVAEYEF